MVPCFWSRRIRLLRLKRKKNKKSTALGVVLFLWTSAFGAVGIGTVGGRPIVISTGAKRSGEISPQNGAVKSMATFGAVGIGTGTGAVLSGIPVG